MPGPILPIAPVEVHRLEYHLRRLGMAHQGAREFMAGQPVSNRNDRLLLAEMVGWYLRGSAPGQDCYARFNVNTSHYTLFDPRILGQTAG